MSGNAPQPEPSGDDVAGARRELERASAAEDAEALYQIGFVLEAQGDSKGAESAFSQADQLRHAEAPVELARYLYNDGNGDAAAVDAAYDRADERGSAEGAFRVALRHWDPTKGRAENWRAWLAFWRADQRGHADAPVYLGCLKQSLGFSNRALVDFERAESRESGIVAYHLAYALSKRDWVRARAIYRRLLDPPNQENALAAAFSLAEICPTSEAIPLYESVADSRDAVWAPYAAVRLGQLCDRQDAASAQHWYDIACTGDSSCISAAHYNFGLVLMTAREFDQALPYLEVACGFRNYPLSEEFVRSGAAGRSPIVTRQMLFHACMAGSTHAADRLEEIAARCRHRRASETGYFHRTKSCQDCGTTWSGVEHPGSNAYPGGVNWTEHNPKASWWLYSMSMSRDNEFPAPQQPARQSSRNTTSAGTLRLHGWGGLR